LRFSKQGLRNICASRKLHAQNLRIMNMSKFIERVDKL